MESIRLKKSVVILAAVFALLPFSQKLPVASFVDLNTTAAIMPSVPAISALQTGLDALQNNDVVSAQNVRDQLAPASLDRHILQWAIALSGSDAVSSAEINKAATDLPDWPSLKILRNNAERALYRENPDADSVIAAFAINPPKTAKGAAILARAHLTRNNQESAAKILSPLWRTAKMEAEDEKLILSEFSGVLTTEDHFIRMQTMLYAERIASAGRVAVLANSSSLYDAWAATIRGTDDAAAKLKALSPAIKATSAFQFVQALYSRKAAKFDQAADILTKAEFDATHVIDADAWWTERRIVARALLERGNHDLAYKVVTNYGASSPASAAEAEFHAGWIALRQLNNPPLAITHFTTLLSLSSKPQSASRGYYWLGRALVADGKDGDSAFRQAAHFGTNFYGQLAAAQLGSQTLEMPSPIANNEDRRRFEMREAVAAIHRLQEIGHAPRAQALYFNLVQELESVGEIALLANKVGATDDHFTTLKIGKIAATRGLDVGALSHPVGAIPDHANISNSGQALAYAIARQESEFNIGAISKAGARGLLQLMPATAQEVARKNGIVYEASKLTSDAAYNATLGAHFLGEQIDRFDGSYILTFAGYNAGPRRAQEWVKKYGDPRGKSIEEVVDWIESIPFSETRNYVQRVMENYQVYKVRLGGSVNIEDDLRFGRRS
jgi:soluble lytic murein transglycosylase